MSRLDGEVELQTRSLKMDVQFEIPLGLSDDLCSKQRRVNRSGNPSRIVAESDDALVTIKRKGHGDRPFPGLLFKRMMDNYGLRTIQTMEPVQH
jgi:hypothetical protein